MWDMGRLRFHGEFGLPHKESIKFVVAQAGFN
jgi:hypothetical protein